MAFIRVKRTKRKDGSLCEYAYVVENRRFRKNKVKQKSKNYLGRVYRFDRLNVMDFYEHYDISDVESYLAGKSVKGIVLDLIKLELFNYGFEEEKGRWVKGNCVFNGKKFFSTRGKIALAFNEGFLSDFTLKRVLNFKAEVDEDGLMFAKYFVESGLAVPQEVFVGVFRKIFK